MAVLSQLERRLIARRTREALAIKKAQGLPLGRPSVLPSNRIIENRAAGDSSRSTAISLAADEVPAARVVPNRVPRQLRPCRKARLPAR